MCHVTTDSRGYNDGSLRLLDEVNLAEGQHVHLRILTEQERVDAALGDLLVKMPEPPGAEDFDEAALREEVRNAFRGLPPLSEAIIAERRSGP